MKLRLRSRGRRRSLPYKIFETFLWVSGLLCLGAYIFVWSEAKIFQDYERWSFEQQRNGREAKTWAYVRQKFGFPAPLPEKKVEPSGVPAAPSESGRLPSPKLHTVPADGLIGRILIPRVSVDAIVREGEDDETLRGAVGHLPGTPLPGDPGNVGIAAHRDTFFRGLRHIRKNDRIEFTTREGSYVYEVEDMRIVTPTTVSVLDPTPAPVLTLITCYPFDFVGHAPKRFIVRARQIKPDETLAVNQLGHVAGAKKN